MNEFANDADAEEFLRSGFKSFIPAVQALRAFIDQIAEKIRIVLRPYDDQLKGIGVASSQSKLSFWPDMGKVFTGKVLGVSLKNPERSAFYIQADFDEQRSRSLYVGFWIWTPIPDDRKSLFSALEGVRALDPWRL